MLISLAECVKYLCIVMDSALVLDEQVTSAVKAGVHQLGIIS